ncbi:MAG: class II aldolase/adducin family protein, partial [Candidatus Omnitrophica bacterium]|nr:class II aldolase/adducin family protein [Candidatus Omnitrophota bacterium]
MRSRWEDRAARRLSALEALVYRSRLIGEDESLGVFGGGNTSIKCPGQDLLGRPQAILWVKGSGADLKGCQSRQFSPLPLAPLRALAARASMNDEEMVAFLERCLLDPKAPRPSIETLLHAFIPDAAVDHTHADAILSLANTRHGERLVTAVLGPEFLWIPYIQPGFALSRRVWEASRRRPSACGAVLEKHGLITWGPDGRTSYLRTIRCVSTAERFLATQRRRRRWSAAAMSPLPISSRRELLRQWLPAIRRTLSRPRKICLTFIDTPEVLAFVNARRMPEVARVGPATPDHMLRTKRLPLVIERPWSSAATPPVALLLRRLTRYAAQHERYVRT